MLPRGRHQRGLLFLLILYLLFLFLPALFLILLAARGRIIRVLLPSLVTAHYIDYNAPRGQHDMRKCKVILSRACCTCGGTLLSPLSAFRSAGTSRLGAYLNYVCMYVCTYVIMYAGGAAAGETRWTHTHPLGGRLGRGGVRKTGVVTVAAVVVVCRWTRAAG